MTNKSTVPAKKVNEEIVVHEHGDDFIVIFPAIIDERTEFPEKSPRLSQRVVFECGEISVVNSFGMFHWINWMRSLPADTQFVFRHCHRKVIDMMNAVEGFLFPTAVVESFYLPYDCTQCDANEEILLQRGKDYVEGAAGQKPRLLYPNGLNCPQCRNTMEVGVMENVFLRFLQR